MSIGAVIRESRLKKSLKQDEVAKFIKVTVQTYNKWENDKTEPKASQIVLLSKLLEITTDEICKGKLNTRYTLEQFIYRLAEAKRYADLETLKVWEFVPDHEDFLRSLKPKSHNDLHAAEEIEDMKEEAHYAVEFESGGKNANTAQE